MKRIFLLVVSLMVLASVSFGQDSRFTKANTLFQDGKFDEAKNGYLDILKTGVQSPELYYNLGNAYYKTGDLASAILNYERASLLAPGDEDIKENLDLANSQIVDKITPLGEFFAKRWIASIRDSKDSDSWAIWAVVSFFLVLGSVCGYLFVNQSVVRRVAFFGGIFLLLINISSFAFALSQKNKLTNRNNAIVFSPTVTVKSSPDLTGAELFILHEGTKVTILRTIGSWAEIQLKDGNVGWLSRDSFEII